jgi:hypothetical protein
MAGFLPQALRSVEAIVRSSVEATVRRGGERELAIASAHTGRASIEQARCAQTRHTTRDSP